MTTAKYIVAPTLTYAVKEGVATTRTILDAKATARDMSKQYDSTYVVVQVKQHIHRLSAEAFYLVLARYKGGVEISLTNTTPIRHKLENL